MEEGKLDEEMLEKLLLNDQNKLTKISLKVLDRHSIMDRRTLLEANIEKQSKKDRYSIAGYLDNKLIKRFFEIDSLITIELCNFNRIDSHFFDWKKGLPKNLENLNLSKSSVDDRFLFELR